MSKEWPICPRMQKSLMVVNRYDIKRIIVERAVKSSPKGLKIGLFMPCYVDLIYPKGWYRHRRSLRHLSDCVMEKPF